MSEGDAGYQLSLPDTVAVVPEPSGRAAGPASEGTPVVAAAAFAGPSPGAAGSMLAATTVTAGQPITEKLAVEAPDPSRVFPDAPSLPESDGTLVASIEPISYAGPVPAYLAPTPAGSGNGFGHTAAPRGRGEIEKLIEKYAALYEVPVELVRHVVNRESTFNPKAYNNGHWGLMQIKHQTARGMGYQGPPSGLLDPETNLKYAVKYLRGAWLVAGGDQKRADRLYQTGYYYEAKRKGMLEATGMGIDRKRRRAAAEEVGPDPERFVRPPVISVASPS